LYNNLKVNKKFSVSAISITVIVQTMTTIPS